MNTLEIIGVAVGLIYLYWEYKANALLWVAGIVMPAIYIFVYFDAGFYADMGINIYYLAAGLFGLLYWMRRDRSTQPLKITHAPRNIWLPTAAITAVLWATIWWILITFTDSTVALGDSFTTALSVVGLWLLARKHVEQWLVWIAVDAVCAWLYVSKGLVPTGILYALYTIIAIFGYIKWRSLAEELKIKN